MLKDFFLLKVSLTLKIKHVPPFDMEYNYVQIEKQSFYLHSSKRAQEAECVESLKTEVDLGY